ncbi:MAG: hypothetical protein K5840_08340 [Eubacterium sp.]|nr:hypothetical protein [Eubacterium sp.]
MTVASIVAIGTVIGGSLAALNTSTNQAAVTEITTNAFSVGITSAGKDLSTSESLDDEAMPGADYDVKYCATNEGGSSGGYDMYVRVTITKQWTDDTELDGTLIELDSLDGTSSYEESLASQGWLVGSENSEQIVLYYTKAVSYGESTSNFIDGVSLPGSLGNEYTGQGIGLDISVNAVQVENAQSAMQAEWGVSPVFDSDGNLTAVSEEF